MIEELSNWYTALEPGLKTYWTIAIVISIIFVIQFIMTLIGIGDADVDVDFDGGGDADGNTLDTGGAMQLFSIRNVINFLLGLGWSGVCFYDTISNPFLLAFVSVIVGCIFVAIFVFMFKNLMKLESNGAYKIAGAKGQVCDVYLKVPARGEGEGIVQVSFGGSVQELPAVSTGDELPTGAKVKVVDILSDKILVVERI